ncbi:MAG: MFS transporter [Pseudomonadota bacterium]|nr:MFS transporter [Pseudomonadota bacterium]
MSRERALYAVLLVGVLNGLGYGLVFPVAALYGEQAGLGPAAITALIALHPLMRLLTGGLWGRLADRYGRRPVLLVGVALQACGHLVFGLAGGPLGLGLGRVLTGLGSGEAVAALAAVADLTSVEERAKGLGMLRAATGIGMLLGPILGGALGLGGLSWPGIAAALVCAIGVGIVAAWFPETRLRDAPPAATARPATPATPLPVPRAALVVAASAAAALAMAECIVPLAVEHVLVPTLTLPQGVLPHQAALALTVGVILAWGLTIAVFDGALSAKVVGRLGETRTLRLGLLMWAGCFALTPPVYALGIVPGGLAVALTAIPVSLTSVGLATWISRTAGPAEQGRASGAAQSSLALGEFIGPAVAGTLYTRWYGLPYEAGAVLLVGAAIAAMTLRPVSGSRVNPQAAGSPG